MAIKILMPALSPTMTEGNLASWLKKEGDAVAAGDVIAEIETDKATMEVEAVDEGVLGQIVIAEGTENVPVNDVIAVLLEDGEDASAIDAELGTVGAARQEPIESNGPPNSLPSSAPAAASAHTQEPIESNGPPGSLPSAAPAAPAYTQEPIESNGPPGALPATVSSSGGRIFASPLARRMAGDAGLNLASVTGTGPHGRIVKSDIESVLASGLQQPAPTVPAPAPSAPPPKAAAVPPAVTGAINVFGQAYTEVKNSGMRKTVARRLTEAKQTIPHFYLTVDCELDALLATRKDLNERAPDGVKLSVNDLIIKAAALALKKVPEANASWTDDAILMYNAIDISVAVAIEGGLITPIIRDADQKGLSTISSEMKDLAGRARDGKLTPEEYQGGGFSVSNLGMFGVKHFDAIINPPQGCILAVGAGEQRPVIKDSAIAIATVMSCTLSVDHRVVDGAVGAQFLQAFKSFIQDPLTMML